MASDLKIRLSLPVVQPLLARIREVTGQLDASERSPDVDALLALFAGDFERTGEISVGSRTHDSLLRATALLRLRLRAGPLAGLSDAKLEAGPNPDQFAGEEHEAILCSLFLATLQETMLTGRRPLAPVPALFRRLWRRFRRWIDAGRRKAHASPDPAAAADSWRVVVLNDPVNLMSYVTHVFESVAALDRDTATRRMWEVHEQKRSTIWTGDRDGAERMAATLRRWYLTIIVEPATDVSGGRVRTV